MTSNFPMPNAQIWSLLTENCPKPSEILRIAKKRCFHCVPRPKNLLYTNFQPEMMINDDFDFFYPQGSKGKSFQDILRGPYRCEKSKKLAELI